MEKQKIGRGYYQAGYCRGFKKSPTVWRINGKAYVKGGNPFQTDLKGYTMVNDMEVGGIVSFYEVGLISEHKPIQTAL